jgi:tetratricopeptide (TPR) repeat protein
VGVAVLAAAVVAAYGRTFSVPFLFDDTTSIEGNATIRHLGTALWPPAGATVSGRPVLNLSLAANYAVGGISVWSYHALNLAIHVLAAWTLFGIVRRTLEQRRVPRAASVAFCSSLLWSLHPLLTESVTYVIQRAESLMGLLYLLTLYCFIRGAAPDTSVRRLWYAGSWAACLLGMATKEVMVTAPIVVLLYDRTFVAGSLGRALRLRRGLYAGLAATWVLLLVLVVSTRGRAGTAGFASGVPWGAYALAQLPALTHYLRLCLWPRPLVFDYGSALAAPAPQFAPSAVLVAGLLAATAWAMARRPALGFLGFCFFAILAPSSSIVPVATEAMAEHRMYLPLIPVVILAVVAVHRLLGRWALAASLALAAALSWATWQRNVTYLSEEGIWADTVSKLPGNERAQNNLGFLLSKAPGRMEEAIDHYEAALRLKPDYAQAHDNLAFALASRPGRLEDAVAHFEEALRLDPDLTEAHYNLACALERLPGRTGEAIAHYEQALRQNPDYAEAHYNLGCLLQKLPGHLDGAIAQFEEALRVRPGLPEAQYNLGRALEAKPGRLNEAIAHYEEALRLKPDYAEAHYSLGGALQESPGRMPEAIRQYEEAVRLKPGFAQAHFNLGFALEAAGGRQGEAIAHYEQAVRLEPGFAEAHYNLACVLQRLPGRMDEAIAHYQEALRLRPDYAEAHCNLGNALDSVGRAREAEAQYAAALRLLPDNATIHLDLALVLLETPGRTAEAVAHLREAIRLQPDNEPARRILSRIAAAAP